MLWAPLRRPRTRRVELGLGLRMNITVKDEVVGQRQWIILCLTAFVAVLCTPPPTAPAPSPPAPGR